MRRMLLAAVLLLLCSGVLPLAAQQQRDYAVTVSHRLSADESQVIVVVVVENLGGDARGPSEITVTALNEGNRVVGSAPIPPLASGQSQTFEIPIPVSEFPPGSVQQFFIQAGVDLEEPIGSEVVGNNFARISVTIPLSPGSAPPATSPEAVLQPLLDLRLDELSPDQLFTLLCGGSAVLLLFWLLTIIVRLVLNRPSRMGNWQPPYANLPPLDPNTLPGWRQAWQQHAENSTLPAGCAEGAVHPRKVLSGTDDLPLADWKFLALRLRQYDMYGYVARSETISRRGSVRRLNRLNRRMQTRPLDPQALSKQVRPIARDLARRFGRRVNKKNAPLAVALDVRLEGEHGVVRISFELYQCQQGRWQQIAHWHPEMLVVGRRIYEVLTYRFYGQRGGESLKDYRRRLEEELQHSLAAMLEPKLRTNTESIPEEEQITLHHLPPVEGDTSPNLPGPQPGH